jgi:two-component system, cell cycle sensor histidine kinase and response regulator CckA
VLACRRVQPQGDIPQEPLSEARLRQMVAHLPFYVAVIDREHRYVWVNQIDRTLDVSRVIGCPNESFVHEQYRKHAFDTIEHAFETQQPTYYEALAYGDGQLETWYGVRIVPLPRDESGPGRALLVSTDITLRRKAEAALRESEARFRLLNEASPDYVSVLDHERRIEYLNRDPPSRSVRREQMLGKRIDDYFRPDERDRIVEAIQRVLDTGVAVTFDNHGFESNRPFSVRVLSLPPADGHPRALMVSTDVSAQRAAEEQRRALEARLAHAQKLESVGQLAGGVAHDFNNMIMIMSLHLEAARDFAEHGQLDAVKRELDQIEIAAKRAADLTRQLLAFARRQPHQPRAVRASEIASNALRLLSRVMPASIKLVLDVHAPDAWLLADSGLIEQVITNLCVNARDALADNPGSITIAVAQRVVEAFEHELASPGPYVTISVADTGPGIPPADLPRIFEPFFTTKPPGKGSGLGLAMVHGIVQQHSGFVTVNSRPGQGATLTVFLPEASPGKVRELTQPRAAKSPEPARILIAEDEPMVRRLIAGLLRRAGHSVVEAENGLQALRVVQTTNEPIDLLILDAVMPEMGGKECYERIHALRPEVPAIFSSGYSADVLPPEFLAEHGLRLIAKPYDGNTLIQAVEDAIACSRQRREPR